MIACLQTITLTMLSVYVSPKHPPSTYQAAQRASQVILSFGRVHFQIRNLFVVTLQSAGGRKTHTKNKFTSVGEHFIFDLWVFPYFQPLNS